MNIDNNAIISHMEARDLIQSMMNESGTSGIELSHAIGKTHGFVSSTLSRNSIPRLDTFAKMAKAMGYELVLKGYGTEKSIDFDDSLVQKSGTTDALQE